MVSRSRLILAAALATVSTVPLSAAHAAKKVLVMGAEGSQAALEAEKSDILTGDSRFDVAGSAGYDLGSGSLPTLAYLSGFDAVLLSSNLSYNFTAVSNLLADYVDAGGGVVISTFWGQESNNAGRLNTAAYNPLTQSTGDAYDARQLGTFNAADPLMRGVTSLNANIYSGDYRPGLAPGATLAASWSDGRPLAAYNASRNVAAITLFPNVVQFNHATGDYRQLFANGLNLVSGGAGAVPEPASWAMMIGGFGLVGGSLRRRRSQVRTNVTFA